MVCGDSSSREERKKITANEFHLDLFIVIDTLEISQAENYKIQIE